LLPSQKPKHVANNKTDKQVVTENLCSLFAVPVAQQGGIDKNNLVFKKTAGDDLMGSKHVDLT
jgi:hypothetical protein